MSFKYFSLASLMAVALATPSFAETHIVISDAYARAASPMSKAGAAFMKIMNHGAENDRLIAVSSDVAQRVELHTHKDMGDGVMKMMEVDQGFIVPAGETHALKRGGDHVMFMGLYHGFKHGDSIEAVLTFEKAGEIVVELPIDLKRKPTSGEMSLGHEDGHGHAHHGEDNGGHGSHNHDH